jgi:hypothetical protein
MDSTKKSETNSTATTKTDPWAPALPQLQGVLNNLGPISSDPGQTSNEANAFAGLMGNASKGNPFAGQINSLASDLLNGGGPDRSGYATGAYSGLQNSLNPIANQSTDPFQNSSFQNLYKTLTNDTTDAIKSQYAGAGYTAPATGDFAQQLGRGISQGVAPAFAQAQDTLTNQRMNAANSLNSGGVGLSGLLSGLDQTALGNRVQGIGASTSALQANDSPYTQMLNLSQQQRNLPFQNIGTAESLLLPIAQLGGTANQTGSSTTNSSANPGLLGSLQQVGSLFAGGAGSAASGAAGWLGLLSDRRAKKDIEQIGKLNDGTPIYRFSYKGETVTHIGLMAQDVETFAPEAVREINGLKHVDYHLATERARRAA